MYKLMVEIIVQNDKNKYEQFLFEDVKLVLYMVERYLERKCLVEIKWVDE